MVPVELRPLLSRLDAACTRALEAAAGVCVARGHYEVTVEHVLLALLEGPRGDLAVFLERFDADAGRLARSLQEVVEDLRTGNAGKPVLSPLLIEWIEDGWLIASIDQGLGAIRSGSLVVALLARPRRYLASDHLELSKLSLDELRRELGALTARSPEEAAPPGASASAPAAAAGRPGTALARFASSFTDAARAGKIDEVLCRDRELRQVIDILARRRKNNPIIVGEAGVGKTAVVEGLALRIAAGDVPDLLQGVEIFGLDLGLLEAGAGVKGEFEARLKAVVDEVKAAAGRVILFIDEAHMLIGGGGGAGGADAANLLKPALARGELRTIAATTWAEYKRYFEEDAALARRFQPVKVDEPSPEEAALMLRGIKAKYEAAHGVLVRDDAIDAAARLAARYITGRLLPDKAVDVLDTAAARVRVGQSSRPGVVEDLERRIGALEREALALARDRRGGVAVDALRTEEIGARLATARADLAAATARWKAQQAAVVRVQEARRLAVEGGAAADPAAAMAALEEVQGKDPLVRIEVDPDVVAQVVGDWTGIPVGRMLRDEAAQLLDLEAQLEARIRGQDHALDVVSRALRGAKVGLKDPNKPQVFLLVGPSGVGKTELGLTIADTVFGGERFVVSVNMSEYQDREMGVSGLIGAKPGYVGYGKGGALTEAVRQRPYSVVLLDEIEKACQEVRNLFYQVFDKGVLTDGTGRAVDFKNTVVVMTSNLTADRIQALCAETPSPDPAEVIEVIRPALSRALQPAWLARTTIVPFYPLRGAALAEITRVKLGQIGARLRESQRIELVVGAGVVEHISARCDDPDTGARAVDAILQGTLLPRVSSELVARMAAGTPVFRVSLSVDAAGQLRVEAETQRAAPAVEGATGR